MIEIVFRNGEMMHYDEEQYTDYTYDKQCFIVIKEKQWVGFFNMDAVLYITIDR